MEKGENVARKYKKVDNKVMRERKQKGIDESYQER